MSIYSWDNRYFSNDPKLELFHDSRNNPIKTVCIEDSPCRAGFGKTIKKGEEVIIEGTVSRGNEFQVAVPAYCGFYRYQDFEPIGA